MIILIYIISMVYIEQIFLSVALASALALHSVAS